MDDLKTSGDADVVAYASGLRARAWVPGGADYAVYKSFFSKRFREEPIDEDYLPPTGVVVEDEQGPAGFIWVYDFAGCPVAWIGWLTTREGLSPRRGVAVAKRLRDEAIALAHERGNRLITVVAYSTSVLKLWRQGGFVVNHDVNVQLFLESGDGVEERRAERDREVTGKVLAAIDRREQRLSAEGGGE